MKVKLLLISLILYTINIHLFAQSWEKQISLPTTSQLHGVHFVDANVGVLAGSGGEILKTTDGGTTWTKIVTNSSDTHNSIFMVSSSIGYVCAYNGKIYKTTDGGDSWTPQVSGTTEALKSIQFIDANTGWVVGDKGTILKTVNGGTNWTAQTSNTTSDLEGVFFLNSNTGWATGVSGYVCKTTNGGTSWAASMIYDATYRHSIYFIDNQTGWAVGRGNTLTKSTDGGSTWAAQTSPVASQQWRIVKFVSSTTGFAVSEGGKIIKTTNAGTNWIEQASGTNESLYGLFFRDQNNGFAVGNAGKILKTTNAGTNWIAMNKGTGQSLYDICFFDLNNGITIGGGGVIFKTTNGGTDWIEKTSNASTDLLSSYYFDSNNGIAVGYGGTILKTTDGGNSWAKTVYPNNEYDFFSVHFPTASVGYIVGYDVTTNYGEAIVIKTVDGGSSWSIAASGLSDIMLPTCINFTDANNGFITGYDWWDSGLGYLYKTSDGGATWNLVTSTENNGYNWVSFINSTTGFFTGASGLIKKTTNGGNTWSTKTTGSTDNIMQVKFISPTTGIALGSSSVLSTFDAGETWNNVLVEPYNSLVSAAVVGNSVWICGGNGLVIKNLEVLPVELTSFTANQNEGKVVLNWSTATEVNNYGFEVERLSVIGDQLSVNQNNLKWELLGFVEGDGNSNSPKEYSFIDENPPGGNLQYRLKQIDTDGAFEYYPNIAEVNFSLTGVEEKQLPTEFGLSQNYPNPFNPETVISFQLSVFSHATLKVYDILGNEVATLVNENKQPGYYNVKFDGSNLSTGVYVYKLTAGSFTSTKKLLLVK